MPRPRPSSLWALLGAWLVSRVLVLGWATDTLPYPDGDLLLNDVRLYAGWADGLVEGRFPVGDEMWQYPPGAGVLFALSRVVASDAMAGFLVLAVLADFAVLAALVWGGRGAGRLQGAWAWVAAGLLVGPVFLARFDVFPTLATVLALLWVAHPVRAGVVAGVGTLLKVWPGVALLALPRRSLPRGVLAWLLTGALGWLAVAAWSDGGLSFVGEQRARGLQVESVAALPYNLAHAVGWVIATEYRFGAMEVDMAGASVLGMLVTLLGVAILIGLGAARLAGRLEDVPGADVVLAAVLVSVATSRVFSPQYAVWLAGVGAVALIDRRTRMRPVLALLAPMALVTQVIYPWGYGSLIGGGVLSVLLQTVRIGLLVTATVMALRAVVAGAHRAEAAPVRGSVTERR